MLIRKGAEANLYLEDWYGLKVIKKVRVPKMYRLPELDTEIRSRRTIREALLLHRAKRAGVPTPTVYLVDLVRNIIILEYLQGQRVKESLPRLTSPKRRELCTQIGELIGRLHKNGIIHGDLTTSNMIILPNETICFIDFGLAENSEEIEKRGIDLHVMKRAFESTHYEYVIECFNSVIEGYEREVGHEVTREVIERVRKIAQRGRYAPK